MKFPELFENLLRSRGITPDMEEEFLKPDYKKLHDPILLPDMEKARDRVIEAMKKNEHIFIFSDYDADGIPGAVVVSDFFARAKYENVSFYIPHRHDEGFGLSNQAIDEAKNRGANLIITIDCGTADLEEAEYAHKKGIDLIITDHHEQKEKLPKAIAVVNPKRKDSIYPFKDLCGAAVAYKLIQAILSKESFGIKEGMEKWSLDMVGIATLSDMVPLLGENRILASFGLEVLRKSPRPGLASLFRKLSMNQAYINEDDIAFMITPRINAASRMGKPEDAFNLLRTNNMKEAGILAEHLEAINNERKGVVASLVKDAKKHLSQRDELKSVIVIGNPEWRPSLLGLVANSLVEEYQRPAFVWGRDGDGIIKGSCRSYGAIDLCELMNQANDSFIEYGGHSQAGGFSVELKNITSLESALHSVLEKNPEIELLEEMIKGIEIELDSIGEDLWKTVSQLAPFGAGNPKPIFTILDAEIKSVKNFGKTGDHLEVVFGTPNKSIKAISFFSNFDTFGVTLAPQAKVKVDAHLEKSYFRNRPELRLRIVDIKK
jgi:single-stranded-DNA-specific exonuclease